MQRFKFTFLILFLLFGFGTHTAISAPTGGNPSTGRAPSTGGKPSTGGNTSAGGAPSTGGKPSTGGNTSAGGTPPTGGAQTIRRHVGTIVQGTSYLTYLCLTLIFGILIQIFHGINEKSHSINTK